MRIATLIYFINIYLLCFILKLKIKLDVMYFKIKYNKMNLGYFKITKSSL